jgi:hypothetical protein
MVCFDVRVAPAAITGGRQRNRRGGGWSAIRAEPALTCSDGCDAQAPCLRSTGLFAQPPPAKRFRYCSFAVFPRDSMSGSTSLLMAGKR